MTERKDGYFDITRHIEWVAEIESDGFWWFYGSFRGEKLLIVKASGIHVLADKKEHIKIRKSQLGAFRVLKKIM